jgi:hypothetical protein
MLIILFSAIFLLLLLLGVLLLGFTRNLFTSQTRDPSPTRLSKINESNSKTSGFN